MSGVDEAADRRIWVRAVNAILARIDTGELKPGSRIPSAEMLTGETGASSNAAGVAYRWLMEQGIIRRSMSWPQGGYVVTGHPVYAFPARPGPAPRPARLAGAGDRIGEAGDHRDWVRVASTLLDRIRAGHYTQDTALPGKLILAAESGVCPAAVSRALAELASRGFIQRVTSRTYAPCPGRGKAGSADPALAVTAAAAVSSTEVTSGGGALVEQTAMRLWVRAVRVIVTRIERGELKQGGPVPGARALAGELGMSAGAVLMAYRYLERKQVIRGASAAPQSGFVVLAGPGGALPHLSPPDWSWQEPLPAPAEPDRVARGLRRIRIERGWKLRDVAARLGVSAGTVSRYETGERRVRMVREVARQLGVTTGYLTRDCPRCSYQPPAGYQCLRCGTPAPADRRRTDQEVNHDG